jgi:hypothetical protein
MMKDVIKEQDFARICNNLISLIRMDFRRQREYLFPNQHQSRYKELHVKKQL